MGHYANFMKLEDKEMLKDYMIDNFISAEEYDKHKDKLILDLPKDGYFNHFSKEEALSYWENKDYKQFVIEVFALYKFENRDNFYNNILYIQCNFDYSNSCFIVTRILDKSNLVYSDLECEKNLYFDPDSKLFHSKSEENDIKKFNNMYEINKNVYFYTKI